MPRISGLRDYSVVETPQNFTVLNQPGMIEIQILINSSGVVTHAEKSFATITDEHMINDCIDYAKLLKFQFKDSNENKKAYLTFLFSIF